MKNNIDYKTLLDFSKGNYSYTDYQKVKHWFMNVREDGKSLLVVESPVHDCLFMNGIQFGLEGVAVIYNIGQEELKSVTLKNWGL